MSIQNIINSSIINSIIKNWPAKVLSIAIAIFIVVFHSLNMQEERFFSSPLTITENGNLLPATQWPLTVRISLRGSADNIYPVLESDIEAYLDLTKYNVKGNYRVPVEVRKKGTAQNVDSMEIRVEPPEIVIELDNKESRYIDLRASITGSVPDGYILVSGDFRPAKVLVDGPVSILDKENIIFSKEIDLNGRTDDFTVSVGIMNINPLLHIHGDGIFEFTGMIRPNLVSRFFERTVTLTGTKPGFEYIVIPKTGGFYLQGREVGILSYEPAGDALLIDVSKFDTADTFLIKPEIKYTDDFSLVRVEPAEYTVQILRRTENN